MLRRITNPIKRRIQLAVGRALLRHAVRDAVITTRGVICSPQQALRVFAATIDIIDGTEIGPGDTDELAEKFEQIADGIRIVADRLDSIRASITTPEGSRN